MLCSLNLSFSVTVNSKLVNVHHTENNGFYHFRVTFEKFCSVRPNFNRICSLQTCHTERHEHEWSQMVQAGPVFEPKTPIKVLVSKDGATTFSMTTHRQMTASKVGWIELNRTYFIVMPPVVMLSVVTPSTIMQSVVTPSVITQSMSIVIPSGYKEARYTKCRWAKCR